MKKIVLGLIILMSFISCDIMTEQETTTFTVTFDKNNADATGTMDVITIEDGATLTIPALGFTLDGYNFKSWNTKADGSGEPYNEGVELNPTNNLILYAQWEVITTNPPTPPPTNPPTTPPTNPTTTFTVTFDTDGGTTVNSITVNSGEKISEPSAPTKDNNTFDGWYKDAAKTIPWDFNTEIVTANLTIYAKWIVIPSNSFTVTFDVDGGSFIAPATVDKGEKVTKPFDPSKNDHVFDGWYKDAAKTIPWDFENDTITAETTIYAKWIVKPANTYTVFFATDGGSKVDPQFVTIGGYATQPPTPVKEGHNFAGWYQDHNLTVAFDFSTKVIPWDNYTIFAKWEAKTYTVTFETGGLKNVAPVSVKYGEKLSTLPSGAVSHHFFYGWYKEDTFTNKWDANIDIVKGDTTLYANLVEIKYSVKFYIDLDPANSTTPWLTYNNISNGSLIDYPSTEPALEKYVFAGWYRDASFNTPWNFSDDPVTYNTSLYAKWLPIFETTIKSDGKRYITKYNGKDSIITVPSNIDGESILGIDENAFWYNDYITEVSIESGIVRINSNAFLYCTNLVKITIPDSVTAILRSAFSNNASLKDVTLPSNLRVISDSTFVNCDIWNISIPDSVEIIDQMAFYGNRNLSGVNFTKNSMLRRVASYAFARSGLNSIVLPGENLVLSTNVFDTTPLRNITLLGINPPTVADTTFSNVTQGRINLTVKDDTNYKNTAPWNDSSIFNPIVVDSSL